MLPYLIALIAIASILGVVLYVSSRPKLPSLPWLLGPLGLTLLTWLYTLVVSQSTRPGDEWALIPVLAALMFVALWHIWLVVKGPGRAVLLAYAVGHLAFWRYFAVVCMLRIDKTGM